jgi:hypothetical protein
MAAAGSNLAGLASGTWFDVVYAICVAIAAVAIPAVVIGRGSPVVLAGCLVAAVGNLAHSAVVIIQVLALTLASGDHAQGARLWDLFIGDAHLLPVVVMMIGYPLGWLIMAAGLARAGVIAWWPVALPIVGIGLNLLSVPHSHDALVVLFAVFGAAIVTGIALGPHGPGREVTPAAAAA